MSTSTINPIAFVQAIGCRGQLLFNEPLANYTTWRVGGTAKQLYKPADSDDLACFLRSLPEEESVLWLGLGSNSLIRDGGFPGTVILTQGCLKEIKVAEKNTIYVEAGVSCATMARFSARNELAGGEFWAGIPGTMGGALRMNAGCHGSETWSKIIAVETINRQGQRRWRKADEFAISYRHVDGLAADEWFIAAKCLLTHGKKEDSLAVIKELLQRRADTQPINEYNCGSVFRNPANQFAAQLIESCDLKGKQHGGASVSNKHANFIINHGFAMASDIESLIETVRETVKEKTGIELIHEVHLIGVKHD